MSDKEMESNSNQEKALKENYSDEDSDELDIVFENVKTAAKSPDPKPANNEVECISLDDSDSEHCEVPLSSLASKSNESLPTIRQEESKKVDYLNLESSDTDDEQERIQNDVNNLLSSAAILNDIECGPTKPVPQLGIPLSLPSCIDADKPLTLRSIIDADIPLTLPSCIDTDIHATLPKYFDADIPVTVPCIGGASPVSKRPSSPSVSVTSCHDDKDNSSAISGENISPLEDLPNKKIKTDPDNTNVNIPTAEELESRVKMYRKDERIVAAYKKKDKSRIPSTLSQTITAHGKTVSSLSWCSVPYSHLLLSSSLDSTVKVWDIYSQSSKPVQTLNIPLGARAAKWSMNGEQIFAGGFGKQLHVFDVLSGKKHMVYKIYYNVSCIAIHPFIEDVILCGTQNAVLGFDLRVDSESPVRTFVSQCGEVLDIAFLNKSEFACSTSVVSHDSADRTIMVWDFNSGAILSNQIFLERYTCPSLKAHPFHSSFIAQTNGDYIVSFSSHKPYKMKNKRYMGHKVSGYGIECDISPDGQYIASGDAGGDVYFYNYENTTEANKITVKPEVPTNRLKWHPVLSSTLAVATYDGQIHVWK